MAWLIAHMWAVLAGSAFLGLLFGWAFRGIMLKGKARKAIVERDVAQTELAQVREEVEALYRAQRNGNGAQVSAETVSGGSSDSAQRLKELTDELERTRKELANAQNSGGKTGSAAAGGAVAGAMLGGGAAETDEDHPSLVWRNRHLESRVRSLEEKLHEASSSDGESVAPIAGAGATDSGAELAKLRFRNEELQQRVAELEDQIIAGTPAETATPSLAPEETSAEAPEEELARLRWRNRYLEGRVAYFEGGDAEGDTQTGEGDDKAGLIAGAVAATGAAIAGAASLVDEADNAVEDKTVEIEETEEAEESVEIEETKEAQESVEIEETEHIAEAETETATESETEADIETEAVERAEITSALIGTAADDIVLIDGIGPATAEALKEKGAGTLSGFASMDDDIRSALLGELGVADKAIEQNWVEQAKEILAGGEPRAKVDKDLLAKLLAGGAVAATGGETVEDITEGLQDMASQVVEEAESLEDIAGDAEDISDEIAAEIEQDLAEEADSDESPLDAAAVSGTEPLKLAGPVGGHPDDLTAIGGIGPKIQEVLNDLGIYHYDQIAAWTPENVAWVDDHLSFSGRIEQEDWVGQAAALVGPEVDA